jgi:hypothetical protein
MSLLDYVEDTESPRHFWLWGGISTIASALQRKVWLPFGLDIIYPNLYVMLVATPGECRKGSPLNFSRKILNDIQVRMFADSPTKRAFTKSLDEIRKTLFFRTPGNETMVPHSSMTVVSRELSSFLAVDPKAMIEALTDLFDSHDEWVYETSGAGIDKLYRVCINCLMATTPEWIANNLPEEAIGGGFTTRLVIVYGKDKYKWIALPPAPSDDLYGRLKIDLKRINTIVGEFKWEKEALEFYDSWYNTIPKKTRALRDHRLRGNLSRIHILALKTAICLHVSYSDELLITKADLEKAIIMLEDSLKTASNALSGHGRSRTAVDVEKIIRQLRLFEKTTFKELGASAN